MMLKLITSLLLATEVMVQIKANDVMQDLNLPPLPEHLFLFDVTSDASAVDVKLALCGLNVRHKFKVIGESRYIFVVHDNNKEKLGQLQFPDGSCVVQYPIEHASDFFNMTGLEGVWEEIDEDQTLDDIVLTMGEFTFLFPENTSTESFISMMSAFGTSLNEANKNLSIISYFEVAAFPPKLFVLTSGLEDNVIQNGLKDVVDTIGGPANWRRVGKKMVKI